MLLLRTTSYSLLPQSRCFLLLPLLFLSLLAAVINSLHLFHTNHFCLILWNIHFALIQIKFSSLLYAAADFFYRCCYIIIVVRWWLLLFFVHCIELPMECVSCATSRSSYSRVNIRLPVNLCTLFVRLVLTAAQPATTTEKPALSLACTCWHFNK